MATNVAVFAIATLAVLAAGPRLARVAEEIADRTSIGQVLIGAVLLGVVTSLPGLVLTVSASARGEADLAVANALGGVAAQTAFLALADVVYGGGAVSSRVPTRQVAFQAAMLMVLLSIVVMAFGADDLTVWRLHPASLAIVVAYVAGLALGRRIDIDGASTGDDPDDPARQHEPDNRQGARSGLRGKMGELEEDADSAAATRSWRSLWTRFALFAAVLVAAGFALSHTGSAIAAATPISASGVGLTLTAVATSTPELVTALAAARRGAIGLAAGDIIGGNTFDTLFLAAADVADRGSVFAAAGSGAIGFAGLAMLLNGIVLAGLTAQHSGERRADPESYVVLVVWVAALTLALVPL